MEFVLPPGESYLDSQREGEKVIPPKKKNPHSLGETRTGEPHTFFLAWPRPCRL